MDGGDEKLKIVREGSLSVSNSGAVSVSVSSVEVASDARHLHDDSSSIAWSLQHLLVSFAQGLAMLVVVRGRCSIKILTTMHCQFV